MREHDIAVRATRCGRRDRSCIENPQTFAGRAEESHSGISRPSSPRTILSSNPAQMLAPEWAATTRGRNGKGHLVEDVRSAPAHLGPIEMRRESRERSFPHRDMRPRAQDPHLRRWGDRDGVFDLETPRTSRAPPRPSQKKKTGSKRVPSLRRTRFGHAQDPSARLTDAIHSRSARDDPMPGNRRARNTPRMPVETTPTCVVAKIRCASHAKAERCLRSRKTN